MAARKAGTATPDTISDPVDWAHHYWQEQGLQGDEQRFLAMTSLLRYQRLVVDAVEEALRAHRLNLTDYLVLMTLQLSENGTRLISNLARSLMVHATTATLATDRLQKRRLISRTPHPTDRRATCITITATGRKLVHKATMTLSEMGFGMGDAKPKDVENLVGLLADLRAAAGDTSR
ncbi:MULTISPECIES: MarR family transcriptional regulator [Thermocrispum]|uniref:MarR family transcriptional regulator n=1 Tax=Thermocrispum agreste TaxID=37925 RepID=A0A2W4IVW5_9PSEU|nr:MULTISPECIES: MarR family transcriptional regulator [Thermocrispum]PZM90764.1 MAG: MarR family transcriptional regulator [Thermocrispum agreste]